MLNALPRNLARAYRGWNVKGRVARFSGWLEASKRADDDGGDYDHTETVNAYYDLCSEFMQFGWNESLHFAPLTPDETLEDSILRHQRLMIDRLQLREGMRVVDVGCGFGGPMRRVARESGASVFCINNNGQQLEKAKRLNAAAGLDHMAEYLQCSFMDMSAIEANTFDGAYAIESTCHAPDKQGAFAEIFRVMKPGALFWGQEMCLTDAFDPDNGYHRAVEKDLMLGIALREIATFTAVNDALEAVGFEIVEANDLGVQEGPSTPWYQPMAGRRGTLRSAFRRTPWGRKAMIGSLRLAEALRVFPRGSAAVVRLMDQTADAYVKGGESGIFTPLYCFLARKPG
ncbi:MAG: methyltransferase domain-containing protein [Gammaproteobacteria bacterium]|nr:methyltransferase domain-containing protein [Gammaproteobacteria bacterium]